MGESLCPGFHLIAFNLYLYCVIFVCLIKLFNYTLLHIFQSGTKTHQIVQNMFLRSQRLNGLTLFAINLIYMSRLYFYARENLLMSLVTRQIYTIIRYKS